MDLTFNSIGIRVPHFYCLIFADKHKKSLDSNFIIPKKKPTENNTNEIWNIKYHKTDGNTHKFKVIFYKDQKCQIHGTLILQDWYSLFCLSIQLPELKEHQMKWPFLCNCYFLIFQHKHFIRRVWKTWAWVCICYVLFMNTQIWQERQIEFDKVCTLKHLLWLQHVIKNRRWSYHPHSYFLR